MTDKWTDAMIELNEVLEECKEAGVSKEEVLQEIENVYGK